MLNLPGPITGYLREEFQLTYTESSLHFSAFAAGVLYGIHEGWPIRDSLTLGLCASASALRSISTTSSVGTVAECLALAGQWGWRQPI